MQTLRKIKEQVAPRGGYGTLVVLAIAIALAVLIPPFTKWYYSLLKTTTSLEEKMEMQSLIQDRWNQINAATFDELSGMIDSKGTTWTESIGGQYEIKIDFDGAGTYAKGICSVGGSSANPCRKVSLTISNKNGQGVPLALIKIKTATLSESQKIQDLKSKIAAAEKKFSSYYTVAQLTAKLAQYYTKAEFDKKLEESGGAIPSTNGSYAISGSGSLSRSFTVPTFCNVFVRGGSSCDSDGDCSGTAITLRVSGKSIHGAGDAHGTSWEDFSVFVPKGGSMAVTGNNIKGYCFPMSS